MDDPRQSAAAATGGKGSLKATVQARAIWPGIDKRFTHENLPKHLFTVAAMHARRALAAAHDQLDQLDRATSIGTSVELLAKAALALISSTLIAEKDPKSLLLYSGIPAIPAHEAKTKMALDCLLILHHSHSVSFSQQTNSKIFFVRNLALHIGQVDATLFEEALNAMTRLSEEILDVIQNYDPTLDRVRFWGTGLLTQVDERLKEEQEVRKLELEQLKAAALRSFERLQRMQFSDEALSQLADRWPTGMIDLSESVPGFEPDRPECPVCGFEGWLGYTVVRGAPYAETMALDGDAYYQPSYYVVDVTLEPWEFGCGVCGLRLHDRLLPLVGMGDNQEVTGVLATDEEREALDEYQIDSYLEDRD